VGYGGPVWHVSTSSTARSSLTHLLALAEGALRDVGDADAGEWWESSPDGRVVHLRRRLTPAEMVAAGITELRDIRGTYEAEKRVARVRRYLPAGFPEV
jgi:hypothetical protein